MLQHRFLVPVVIVVLCSWPDATQAKDPNIVETSATPASIPMTVEEADERASRTISVYCGVIKQKQSLVDRAYAVKISRRSFWNIPNGNYTVLAETSQYGSKVINLAPASVVGDIITKYVKLIMEKATCRDAGQYRCSTSVSIQAAITQSYTFVNITFPVSPGKIAMRARETSDTLAITCDAIVGSALNETEVEWFWEYRSGSGAWQKYDGNSSDITIGKLRNGTHDKEGETCYQSQTSRLKRPITPADKGREYRCYVANKRNGENNEKLARVYSLSKPDANPPNDKGIEPVDSDEKGTSDSDYDNDNATDSSAKATTNPPAAKAGATTTAVLSYVALAIGLLLFIIIGVAVWRSRSRGRQKAADAPRSAVLQKEPAFVPASYGHPSNAWGASSMYSEEESALTDTSMSSDARSSSRY